MSFDWFTVYCLNDCQLSLAPLDLKRILRLFMAFLSVAGFTLAISSDNALTTAARFLAEGVLNRRFKQYAVRMP